MHLAISAIALCAAATLTTPVLACSQSDGQYQQPKSAKPLIELKKLSDAQQTELKAYALALKEQVGAIAAEATQAEAAATAQPDAPKPSDEDRARARQATAAKMVELANRLGEDLSFRTTITVGNGMLCGAQIEVQLPPAPGNIEIVNSYGSWTVHTWGKGRSGGRERGVFYPSGLLEHIEYELKQK